MKNDDLLGRNDKKFTLVSHGINFRIDSHNYSRKVEVNVCSIANHTEIVRR